MKISKYQAGFTVIEAVIVVVVLALVGLGGKYAWDKHKVKSIEAHAASNGALIGQWNGATAYACHGTYNIKITVWRTSGKVDNTVAGISSPVLDVGKGGGPGDPTHSAWLYGEVQSYLLPYKSGQNNFVYGNFFSPGDAQSYSLTSKYTGSRVTALGVHYPATDGLPVCS